MADSNDHQTDLKDKPASLSDTTHNISSERQSRSESRHSTQSPADSISPTKDGPSHSPNRKDREDRIKILQEKRKEEQQKKLDELRQAQLQAQKVRERQEDERRRKIEELKARDEHRRAAVEERRRRLLEIEKERREAFWKRAYEREAKIETVKAQQRHSMYAFGSSTSRFLGWEPAHTSRRAASQNNLNRKPLEKPAEKRSSSACSYDRQSSGKLKSDGSPISSTPNNTLKRLSPFLVNAHRKRTDLVPAIPGTNRSTNLTSTPGMNSRSFSGYHYYCTHSPTSPSRSFSNQSDRSASSQASASSSVRSRGTVRKPRPVSIAGTLPDHTPNTTVTTNVTHNRKSRSTERLANKPPPAITASADKPALHTRTPAHRTSTPVKGPLKPTAGSPSKISGKEPELKEIKEIKIPGKPAATSTPIKSPSPIPTPIAITPQTPATTPALEEIPMDSSFTSKQRLTCEEEAKAALAERRRLAREQAEKEAELERLRQEEEERQEQENLRLEAEEAARIEAEQNRIAEEFRRSEEEKLRKAIEENDRRLREEKERFEEEQKQKEEADKKAREEADRLEVERLERARKEEIERIERKRRVEAIMKRTRKFDSAAPKTDTGNDGNRFSPDEDIKTDTSDKESPKIEKMDTSIQELSTPTQELNSFTEELNTSTQELSTSTQELNTRHELDTSTQKLNISIQELNTSTTEELNTAPQELNTFTEEFNAAPPELNTSLHELNISTPENDKLLEDFSITEIDEVDKLKLERISTLIEEKVDLSIKENDFPITSNVLIEEKETIVNNQGNSSIIITTMTETYDNVPTDVQILHDNGLASPIPEQTSESWNSVNSVVVNSSSTRTVISNGVDGNILNFMMDNPIFQPELPSNLEQKINSYESKTVRTSSLSDDLVEFDMLTTSSEPQQQHHESHQADFEELIDLSSYSNKNEGKVGALMDHLMNNEDDVNSNTVTSNGPTGSPLIAFDDNVTKKQDNVAADLL